jgi:hypothetical protein
MASASGWPTKVAETPCSLQQRRLEREQAQHVVGCRLEPGHARSPRQAQIDGQTKCTVLYSGRAQPRFEPEVEVRCVDADENPRPPGQQSPSQLPTHPHAARAGAQHRIHVAEDTEALVRPPGLEALRHHARPTYALPHAVPGQRERSPASSRPASRSPEASPATIAGAAAPSPIVNARCRAQRRPEKRQHQRHVDRRLGIGPLPAAPRSAWRAAKRQALPVDGSVHLLDSRNALGRVATPTQALGVDARGLRRIASGRDERRQILRQSGLETGHRMRADSDELVHAGQSAQERPVAQVHVATSCVVGEDGVAAERQSCAMCT